MDKSDITGFPFKMSDYMKEECFQEDRQEKFFEVYNELFMKIKVDEEETKRKVGDGPDFLSAPNFGNKNTPFSQVDAFYEYWEKPVTLKEFAWADKWDPETDGDGSRYVKRMIEKENKKERQNAKKTYLNLIKKLVAFVKARDFRVNLANEENERIKKEKEKLQKE